MCLLTANDISFMSYSSGTTKNVTMTLSVRYNVSVEWLDHNHRAQTAKYTSTYATYDVTNKA